MPQQPDRSYDGNFNASAECWGIFTEVAGQDFSNAVLFEAVHQLTVDAYAVQHAGGLHPDKSVGVHLSGLYLAIEIGLPGPHIAARLKHLADLVENWPHFAVPPSQSEWTIFDLALEDDFKARIEKTNSWARQIWQSWPHAHDQVRALVHSHLDLKPLPETKPNEM